MCERLAVPDSLTIEKESRVGVDTAPFGARYNVSVGGIIPLMKADEGGRPVLTEGRWTDAVDFLDSTNLDTSDEVPQRCLVPILGWYEWKSEDEPFFTRSPSRSILSIGGVITSGTSGKSPMTVTLLKRGRAPLLVRSEDRAIWLSGNWMSVDVLVALAKCADSEKTESYPVRTLVGDPKNEGPELIRPLRLWPHPPTGTRDLSRRL